MTIAVSEPFPPLGSHPPVHHGSSSAYANAAPSSDAARRRRKSSAIGELRHGDTGPALATSRASMAINRDALAPLDPPPEAGGSRHHHHHPLPSGAGSAAKSPTAAATPSTGRVSKRRRARGFLRRVRQTLLRRTYVLPALTLAACASAYMISPGEHNPLHRLIFLSYPSPPDAPGSPVMYGKGPWDMAFVAFYTVVLSFTREFIMQEVLRPLALRYGLRSRFKQARFMEQMYTAFYFGILGPVGLWVMSRTPVWYYNTRGMYEGFPHLEHEAPFKFYYLFQAAYWTQQAIVLVLGMEARRKDFKELVCHHVITLSLIYASYRFHFTYMGIVVYTTHDISDFFLATSKSLKYVDSPIVPVFYFVFVCVWVYMRHFLNLRVLWSIVSFNAEFVTVGPYFLDWEGQYYKCDLARVISGVLLSALQALNLFWLFYILRIAYRFVRDRDAEDDRSEADPDELEEMMCDVDKSNIVVYAEKSER